MNWRGPLVGTLIGLAATGLVVAVGAAADSRWLPRTEYLADQARQAREALQSEVRTVERIISEVEAELRWETDDRRRAALQERLSFLINQKADLERKLALSAQT